MKGCGMQWSPSTHLILPGFSKSPLSLGDIPVMLRRGFTMTNSFIQELSIVSFFSPMRVSFPPQNPPWSSGTLGRWPTFPALSIFWVWDRLQPNHSGWPTPCSCPASATVEQGFPPGWQGLSIPVPISKTRSLGQSAKLGQLFKCVFPLSCHLLLDFFPHCQTMASP